jgi:hypothetical protein
MTRSTSKFIALVTLLLMAGCVAGEQEDLGPPVPDKPAKPWTEPNNMGGSDLEIAPNSESPNAPPPNPGGAGPGAQPEEQEQPEAPQPQPAPQPAPEPAPPAPEPDPAPAPEAEPPPERAPPPPPREPQPAPSPEPQPEEERPPAPGPREQAPNPQPRPGPDAEPVGCNGIDTRGRCDGDTAVWCDHGRIAKTHCAIRFNTSCGLVGPSTGFFCLANTPPTIPNEPESSNPDPAPQDADPEQAGCGDVDYLGICEGDTAVWCSVSGVLQTIDCRNDRNQGCSYINDNLGYFCRDDDEPDVQEPAPRAQEPDDDQSVPPQSDPGPSHNPDADPCHGVDYHGQCEGDVAVWCADESLRRMDCRAESDQGCGWAGENLGYFCVDDAAEPAPQEDPQPQAPEDDCEGIDFNGECRGQTAIYCSGGRLVEVNCETSDTTCGWGDDGLGYYCR